MAVGQRAPALNLSRPLFLDRRILANKNIASRAQ